MTIEISFPLLNSNEPEALLVSLHVSEAQVGFGDIDNLGVIVSHECDLGEVANISPGVILAGEVQVETQTLVGMGGTIKLKAKIVAGRSLATARL